MRAHDFDIPAQAKRRRVAIPRRERYVEPLRIFLYMADARDLLAMVTYFGPFLACTSSRLSTGMARLASAARFMMTCWGWVTSAMITGISVCLLNFVGTAVGRTLRRMRSVPLSN